MTSEASRKKAEERGQMVAQEWRLLHFGNTGSTATNWRILGELIATAIDAARAEGERAGLAEAHATIAEAYAAQAEAEQHAAERERWECHEIADSWSADFEARGQDEHCTGAGKVAISIAARGPMRGPEEGE